MMRADNIASLYQNSKNSGKFIASSLLMRHSDPRNCDPRNFRDSKDEASQDDSRLWIIYSWRISASLDDKKIHYGIFCGLPAFWSSSSVI